MVAVACVATLVLNSLLQISVGYCVVVSTVSNCRDVISLTSMTSLPVVSSGKAVLTSVLRFGGSTCDSGF